MARTVGIGIQDFAEIITNDYFYIDKTDFIKEWWESGDSVTLITRPRRFGKTLNMNMLDYFFSVKHSGRSDLFEKLSIWKEEKYRELQGIYPVISLSFANVKEQNYKATVYRINQLLMKQYEMHSFLKESSVLSDSEMAYFERVTNNLSEEDAPLALHQLSDFLCRYYGKKVIILLDEYDTPMQEAYVNGFWDELSAFLRSMFNSTFKTNPYLARAIMTGVTRVSKESIFSDLNNLKVITTTSDKYAPYFGFSENEVFNALEECGMGEEKQEVKKWYDGFCFGSYTDIYNPWSILNFLDTKKYDTYWANTSSNSLVGKLIREGNKGIKIAFEALLRGETIRRPVDEQIVYSQLEDNEDAIWSLLLASGYLKVISFDQVNLIDVADEAMYELAITNNEVLRMFYIMVKGWFKSSTSDYNDFVKAMLMGDLEAMNAYMNDITLEIFSYFDTGAKSIRSASEKFYHGFVLGLIVELWDKYSITSNRESGFGRYDVMLEPKNKQDDAIILEFKVYNEKREKSLTDTVHSALQQIEDKKYETVLIAKGIEKERIRKYGFAFEGKNVLIG